MTAAATSLPDPGEEYDGPAVIVAGEHELPVEVMLRGAFQPLDGRFHWWGRIARDSTFDAHCRAGDTVLLRVGTLEASGRLSDLDTWGRLRITGTGRPPFR